MYPLFSDGEARDLPFSVFAQLKSWHSEVSPAIQDEDFQGWARILRAQPQTYMSCSLTQGSLDKSWRRTDVGALMKFVFC